MNRITEHRRPRARYMGIHTYDRFQEQLFTHALDRYRDLCPTEGLGSVLVLCSTATDARYVVRYPFTEILITGLGDQT